MLAFFGVPLCYPRENCRDVLPRGSTIVVRSFHLSATHDGCSAPECLRTRVDCDGSFWQSFLVIKRTMVALDPDRRAARAVALAAPRASEVRDLQRAVDRLSCDGALGFHVVMYEA